MIKKIFNKLLGKRQEAISFRQGFELTELPVITLWQGDKKYNFLLDTGSNNSVIDSNVLKHMEYEKIEKSTSFCGVEGISKTLPICRITVSYKDKKYPYEYVINDMKEVFGSIKKETGVTLHGIIGSKFFNQFKYILDFEELIAYSKV